MENEKNYLEYLAELYPTIEKAATEIINLQSVINLPKGTEHFLSDIHGEYEAFSHVLRNGSGAVRKKIDDVFGHTLGISEKRALATLIYYPRERLEMEKKQQEDIDDWYKVMLYRLIDVCKIVSSKIHPCQSAESPAGGLWLYHRGADHRKAGGARQRSILRGDHPDYPRNRKRRELHHCRGRADSAARC